MNGDAIFTRDNCPFLRSPPFPGMTADTGAISVAAEAGTTLVDDDVLARIAQARVGGEYWGHRPQGLLVVVREGVPVPAALIAGLDTGQIGILPAATPVPTSPPPVGRWLPLPCDPWSILPGARSVHAEAQDDLAMVAALLGIEVYGLDGQQTAPEHLKAAARQRIGAARYRDCFTGQNISVEQAIDQLAQWRTILDANRSLAAASGMAFWKKEAIGSFLWDGLRIPPLLSADKGLETARRGNAMLAVWPSRVPDDLRECARARDIPIACVEDGFLRSKGLGAGLHAPGSIVIDHRGIYYDATRPSDLEHILAHQDFDSALIERAKALRRRICDTGVTKYGAQGGADMALPAARRTVLAVGQVDDDMSVKLGGAGVAGNLDFLRRVRQSEPDAWIVYRPHPDVQAGHRKGHVADRDVLAHADAIDDGGSSLMGLVSAVDEVHVLSSLTGFEALMRGRSVTVHGMPFYAGWGLTRDLAQVPTRRGRLLTIDQLVAAALILYPRYLDPVTRLPCSPELMVDRIGGTWTPQANWLIPLRALQGKLRRIVTLAVEKIRG